MKIIQNICVILKALLPLCHLYAIDVDDSKSNAFNKLLCLCMRTHIYVQKETHKNTHKYFLYVMHFCVSNYSTHSWLKKWLECLDEMCLSLKVPPKCKKN